MRKHVLNSEPDDVPVSDQHWLNLEDLADVQVTSEDAAYPIENALISKIGVGWRAAQGSRQKILLLFHEPQRIEHINLVFQETKSSSCAAPEMEGSHTVRSCDSSSILALRILPQNAKIILSS